MDILFIGPYRQYDGWGRAAGDYLLALDKTEHCIAARAVYTLNSDHVMKVLPDAIAAMEQTVFDSLPDIIIQNMLPPTMEYQHGMKNIGLVFIETNNLQHTGWPTRLNLMDEVWVASKVERQILINSGVNTHICVIPMPVDANSVNIDIEPLQIENATDDFIFYFIGELIPRKNIEALSLAFHREFSPSENVKLLLKLSSTMLSSSELLTFARRKLSDLKGQMRLYEQPYGYNPEFLITDNLTEDEMCSLHQLCDCFVMPSRGESLSRPIMDALLFENEVIVTDGIGAGEDMPVRRVRSHETPVLTNSPPVAGLYTSHETWMEIDVLDLQQHMRDAFEQRSKKRYPIYRQIMIDQFSHDRIAHRLQEIL